LALRNGSISTSSSTPSHKKVAFAALKHKDYRWFLFATALAVAFYSIAQTIVQLEAPAPLRGRLIGLFSMSAFGLRAFSGVTVGVLGGLIGIHWSLALSAMALLAVTLALFAFVGQRQVAREPG
jgi:hypothetical protein